MRVNVSRRGETWVNRVFIGRLVAEQKKPVKLHLGAAP